MKKSQILTTQTFGNLFRNKRITLGLTLRSFCERFGYDPGNVSRLERNIFLPSLDDEKLAGYAMALQIKRDSEEWVLFHDLAHTAKGALPKDLLKNPQILSVLPAFYRTVRGEKLNKNKIKDLIRLLNMAKGK